MEPSNTSVILSLPTLLGNRRMSSPKLLYIPDLIAVSLFLLIWAWFTDGWGLWNEVLAEHPTLSPAACGHRVGVGEKKQAL